MKSIVLGLVVLAAVLIVGGVVWLRSSASTKLEATPEPTTSFEKVTNDTAQFLQEEPVGALDSGTPTPLVTSPATAPATAAVQIIIDESGFSPAEVTVAVGTTVTFVNNGQALHWPASDSHPTHTLLSEFDSKRGLATGEEYTMTFTKSGTWNFHDHLQPSSTGVVTVK